MVDMLIFLSDQFITGTKRFKQINLVTIVSPFTNQASTYLNNDSLIYDANFNLIRYVFVTKTHWEVQ